MKTIVKLSLAVLAISAMQTQAATTRIDGDKFDVIYDDSLVGLFGAPSLFGDTLVFSPTVFFAESDSKKWGRANSTFTFQIVADQGHHLDAASLVESGDYELLGDKAQAHVGGQLRSFDVRTPTVVQKTALTGAGIGLLTQRDVGNVDWQASANQTFTAGAETVVFTIENLLRAKAGSADDYAFIEKKYIGLTVSAVPEAETWAMMLGGLGMIGLIARRRISRV